MQKYQSVEDAIKTIEKINIDYLVSHPRELKKYVCLLFEDYVKDGDFSFLVFGLKIAVKATLLLYVRKHYAL